MKDLIFIVGVTISFALSTGISLKNRSQTEVTDILQKKFNNPILSRVEQFEEMYEVNLSAVKHLVPGDLFSPNKISLLYGKEKNYDVLIFGDSSVYMGFSPQVIRQLTNKKVGFFSYAALSMNKNLLQFIDYATGALLKDDGLVLFVFNHVFWGKQFLIEQENPELEKLIKRRDLFEQKRGCVFCAFTQKRHYEAFEKTITDSFGLPVKNLTSFTFYNEYLAQFVSPQNYAKKNRTLENRLKRGRYIFDDSFVFVHMDEPIIIDKKPPLLNLKPYENNNIQLIVDQLAKKSFKFAFIIPLTTDDKMREYIHRIYNTFFSERLMADMNYLMPAGWKVEGQNLTHMSNMGSFYQGLLLAKWLNQYFQKKTEYEHKKTGVL